MEEINLIICFFIILFLFILRNRVSYENYLYKYAAKGNIKELKKLISENNIETKDKQGKTPLFYALDNNQKETVQFLISKGANVNVLDINGNSPLDYAKTKEMKYFLVANGAKSGKELQNN